MIECVNARNLPIAEVERVMSGLGHKDRIPSSDDMAALGVAKKELRGRMKRALAPLSAENISSQTQNAVNRLVTMPEYQSAKRISVYLSMPKGEISTAIIVRNALETSKKVFVPYSYKMPSAAPDQPATIMDMLSLQSLSDLESLKPNSWSIPTLDETSVGSRENCFGGNGLSKATATALNEDGGLDLIVMPGVAFDSEMGRLGHGKGFYDYFLSRYRLNMAAGETLAMPHLVGLCLREQLLPPNQSVPTDSSDWRLDSLITGDGRLLKRGSLAADL